MTEKSIALRGSFKDRRGVQMKRNRFNRPKLNEANSTDRLIWMIIAIALTLTVYTVFFRIEYKWELFSGERAEALATNFFRVDLVPTATKIQMALSLLNTLALSLISTIVGFFGGIVLGLFAARNISNEKVASAIYAMAGFFRAVPTIIWVLIFVSGYGLSATTAVVGMFFHTLAFFIKSFAESFEEVDHATIEALMASGATWGQVVFGAVIPSAVTKIISWAAIRYEQNFATAVIIGPAVGVPGTIGTEINAATRMGDYATQGFGVLLIILTALVMETIINRIRRNTLE